MIHSHNKSLVIPEISNSNVDLIMAGIEETLSIQNTTSPDDKVAGNGTRERECVNIIINSLGGEFEAGKTLFYFLKECKEKIYIQTKAYGRIASMAIPIFLIGENKIISQGTEFYFHESRYQFKAEVPYRMEELQRFLDNARKLNRDYCDLILQCFKKPKFDSKQLLSFMRNEKILTAEKIMVYGMADQII